MTKFLLSSAAIIGAAFILTGSPASANQCQNSQGQWVDCPVTPPVTPPVHNPITIDNKNVNNNTNTNIAGAFSNSDSSSTSNSTATVGDQTTNVEVGGSNVSNDIKTNVETGDVVTNVHGGPQNTTVKTGDVNNKAAGGRSNSNATGGNARGGNSVISNVGNSNYKAAANAVNVGPAVIGSVNDCMIGGGLGGSSIGQTFGGNFGVLDKACMQDRQNARERAFICQTFGNHSKACASATYHSGGIAAMSMVEGGNVNERAGVERVGVVPNTRPQREATIVEAWTQSQRRPGVAAVVPNSQNCPQGSKWDGRGCWADDVRKVRR